MHHDAAQAPVALIETHRLVVGYSRPLLPPIDLTISRGELWALVGPNGGGKTTLLRTLLGLLPPISGRLERAAARVSYVSQRPDLDSSIPARVVDIVRGGLDHGLTFLAPGYTLRRRRAVHQAMEWTNIAALAKVQYRQLSEGQKQRVLLAQAIVASPALVALDEPTSAMDRMAEARTFELLDRLRHEHGFAVVLITHDLHRLAARATHAVFVDKDRGIAIAGTFDDITGSQVFIERYGFAAEGSAIADAVLAHTPLQGKQP